MAFTEAKWLIEGVIRGSREISTAGRDAETPVLGDPAPSKHR